MLIPSGLEADYLRLPRNYFDFRCHKGVVVGCQGQGRHLAAFSAARKASEALPKDSRCQQLMEDAQRQYQSAKAKTLPQQKEQSFEAAQWQR